MPPAGLPPLGLQAETPPALQLYKPAVLAAVSAALAAVVCIQGHDPASCHACLVQTVHTGFAGGSVAQLARCALLCWAALLLTQLQTSTAQAEDIGNKPTPADASSNKDPRGNPRGVQALPLPDK
jgi:hypothetical protein